MSSGTATNAKETLINELQTEINRIELRLRELQSLIDQSQAEVRRLQQRSVDVTTQMQRLEANFDTVPRNDIKVIYTNAIDTKTRLLTMQSQLEKVQQDRTGLESFGKLLRHIKDMLEGTAITVQSSPLMTGIGTIQSNTLSPEVIIRIVESQESERQRLARQMHDGPAQSLTNFILQAEICRRLFDRNPDRAVEELENLKTAASTTFQKVRDFIFDLRPMMLDDLGLVPTIRRYVTALQEKGALETRISVTGEERRRMEPHTEVTMFRAVQEVLAYARDMSGANRVELSLNVSDNPITADIIFNGKSIEESESQAEQSKGKGFSLTSLQHRIELIGGTIEMMSGLDNGDNKIDISLPAEQFN
jgi:two-component system sensor histidine kinase DegS